MGTNQRDARHPRTQNAELTTPMVARLRGSITRPLDWSATGKCVLAYLVVVALTGPIGILTAYQVADPERAPYLDHSFVGRVAVPFVGSYCATALALAALALGIGRRWPESRAFVYLTSLTIFGGSGVVTWLLGLFTNPLPAGVVLGSVAVGLVLFEKRPVLYGLALWAVSISAITTAQVMGYLRYAPAFAASPVEGGRLSPIWLMGTGGAGILLLAGIVVLIYWIVDRWHDREAKLTETSEQLSRANDIISRYLASQLVEQIRTGDYDAIERRERRKLTLFFSDIEDFAATADRVEPEDLAAILNEYLAEMTDIGKRYGATIDKFVGDAVIIFFGAPSATDDRDHALRAVKMAMEMQERMTILQERWRRQGFEYPFRIRIGINTGHASIGNFGSPDRMDYTAIGRQVNLAARLQGHCEPGGILVSYSTWALIREEVSCTPRGEVQIKGLQQPVRVYEVDRAAPAPAA